MYEFWDRIATVKTNGVTITYPDISFDFKVVFEEDSKEPPSALITFRNLHQDTEGRMNVDKELVLHAGHDGVLNVLMIGTIVSVNSYRSGLDRLCEVQVIDNAKPLNVMINKSFSGMRKASSILRILLDQVGLEIGALSLPGAMDITYPDGRTFNSKLKTILNEITKDAGAKWYIKNNMIYIVHPTYVDGVNILMNEEHGMINSPTRLESEDGPEWSVVSLLNPRIQIGTIMQIESKNVFAANGEFRVVYVSHQLSGKTYYTIAEVVSR